METDALIQHIERLTPLTKTERNAICTIAKSRNLRKKQVLLNEGDICRTYNFVEEGCLRMFIVDPKGTERILQFASKGWWIADIGSFHTERPSQFYIEAIEASKVLQIRKTDLLDLYTRHPKMDRYFRVLMENAFIKMQERVVQNISSTAEERYHTFLEQYEHLINRIPQTYIASFIGVTPEFLSKLRNTRRQK